MLNITYVIKDNMLYFNFDEPVGFIALDYKGLDKLIQDLKKYRRKLSNEGGRISGYSDN